MTLKATEPRISIVTFERKTPIEVLCHFITAEDTQESLNQVSSYYYTKSQEYASKYGRQYFVAYITKNKTKYLSRT